MIDPATGLRVGPLSELWSERPVILHLIRRFGCPLCREYAADLSSLAAEAEAMGVSLVAIGSQQTGWKEFVDGRFFRGAVYVDPDTAVFKALALRRLGFLKVLGTLFDREAIAVYKRANARGYGGDFKGDGAQLGGTWVIDRDGSVLLDHRMTTVTDHADIDEVREMLEVLRSRRPPTAEAAPPSPLAGGPATTAAAGSYST